MEMEFSDHQISRLFINWYSVTLTLVARPSEYISRENEITYYLRVMNKSHQGNDHNNYFLINSLVFQSLEITISNDDDDEEEEEDIQEINEVDAGILQTQAEQD
ncbi:hypothetical protein BDC45DRAFT_533136 [Circinella umbellata]|nr:hypothetical protein BDC45DRAFT_533136 [Circinella umbellata]